jgi:hypothetical protein
LPSLEQYDLAMKTKRKSMNITVSRNKTSTNVEFWPAIFDFHSNKSQEMIAQISWKNITMG